MTCDELSIVFFFVSFGLRCQWANLWKGASSPSPWHETSLHRFSRSAETWLNWPHKDANYISTQDQTNRKNAMIQRPAVGLSSEALDTSRSEACLRLTSWKNTACLNQEECLVQLDEFQPESAEFIYISLAIVSVATKRCLSNQSIPRHDMHAWLNGEPSIFFIFDVPSFSE